MKKTQVQEESQAWQILLSKHSTTINEYSIVEHVNPKFVVNCLQDNKG